MNTLCDTRMGGAVMAAALSANRGRIMGDKQDMMGLYMDKLKDLLPQCSNDTNVSKLELIQHVIDYIGDLQDVLTSDSESESDSRQNSPVSYNYTQQDDYTSNYYQSTYEDSIQYNAKSYNYNSNYNEGIIESETMYGNNTYNNYNDQYNQINYHGSMNSSNDLDLCSMMDSSCNVTYGYSSGYSSDGSNGSL